MAEDKMRISETLDNMSRDLIIRLSGKDTIINKKMIDNVFSFVSLAGGAGASTLLANTAVALHKRGLQVVVIDLNIAFPIQQLFFSSEQKLEKDDLVSLIMGDTTLGTALEERHGIYLLYAHNRLLYDKILMDSAIASKSFSEIIKRLSGLFDAVLIDIPTKGELEYEITNTALYESDYIYSVMDENTGCVSAYNRLLNNFNYVGIASQPSTFKIIMNKRTYIHYPATVFTTLGAKPEVIIPYDLSVVDSGLRGGIYIESGKVGSQTSKQFVGGITLLAEKIMRDGGYFNTSEDIKAGGDNK